MNWTKRLQALVKDRSRGGRLRQALLDSVITANWQQDLALLLKADGDADLRVNWFTLYSYNPGSPTAIRQAEFANPVFLANVGTAASRC
jgi:hypothetical protein